MSKRHQIENLKIRLSNAQSILKACRNTIILRTKKIEQKNILLAEAKDLLILSSETTNDLQLKNKIENLIKKLP